jgi:hypothetical protein
MSWSLDNVEPIISQFEHLTVSPISIVYSADTPGIDDPVSCVLVKEDTFPDNLIFTENMDGVSLHGKNLIGFFNEKIKIRVNMYDDSERLYLKWEDLDNELLNIKSFFEYIPPSPSRVTKYFSVVITTITGTEQSKRYGIEVIFDHTPGSIKMLQITEILNRNLQEYLTRNENERNEKWIK